MDRSSSPSPPPPVYTRDDQYEEETHDDGEEDGYDILLAYEPRQPRVETLPKIIHRDLLPLLPVHSLLRFRCVSRSFKRRISMPIFASQQTQLHRSLSGVFCCDPKADPHSFYFPFLPASANGIPDSSLAFLGSGHIHVVASSGGLLCCSVHSHSPNGTYIICNPASPGQDYTELPPSPNKNDGVALSIVLQLGYVDNDYMLICTFVSTESSEPTRGFAVFSSCDDGQWRVCRHVIAGSPPELLSRHGIVVGGKAYWRTVEGFILCYDAVEDCSVMLSVPEEVRSRSKVWQLSELGGRLCCMSYFLEDGVVVLYVVTGDGGWVEVRSMEIGKDLKVRPVTAEGSGREVVLWVEGHFLGCNTATGERRELCEMEAQEAPEFLPYVSTFAFVKKLHCKEEDEAHGNRAGFT